MGLVLAFVVLIYYITGSKNFTAAVQQAQQTGIKIIVLFPEYDEGKVLFQNFRYAHYYHFYRIEHSITDYYRDLGLLNADYVYLSGKVYCEQVVTAGLMHPFTTNPNLTHYFF